MAQEETQKPAAGRWWKAGCLAALAVCFAGVAFLMLSISDVSRSLDKFNLVREIPYPSSEATVLIYDYYRAESYGWVKAAWIHPEGPAEGERETPTGSPDLIWPKSMASPGLRWLGGISVAVDVPAPALIVPIDQFCFERMDTDTEALRFLCHSSDRLEFHIK